MRENCGCIIQLYEKDDELIEECLHFWFCTFIRLYTSGDIFTNVYGWSAAIEYIVRGEQGNKMTQSELEMYIMYL